MKKFLLITTAMISLAASSALAEGPTVSVGGIVDFQAAHKHQKAPYNNNMSTNNKKVAFHSDALAHIKAEGKTDNGLGYGGVVALTTQTNRRTDYSGEFDKTYVFLESGLGKVELGSNYSAAKTMKVGADSIGSGTGGAAGGDSALYANSAIRAVGSTLTTGTPTAQKTLVGYDGATPLFNVLFLTSADHFQEVTTNGNKEATRKITYYSPRYAGFQVGVSYTPDSANNGDSAGASSTSPMIAGTTRTMVGDAKNIVSAGLNYTNQFDQVTLSASATGEFGNSYHDSTYNTNVNDPVKRSRKNLQTYELGASLNYANFTIAGSYGNWGKSLLYKNPTAGQPAYKNSYYYTGGLAYEQGPVKASVTYFESHYQKNKFQNVSVGADYNLAPGMNPYAEVSFVEAKAADVAITSRKTKATVYILGTMLKF